MRRNVWTAWYNNCSPPVTVLQVLADGEERTDIVVVHGVAPERISILGDSAGSQLTLMAQSRFMRFSP